MQVVLNHVHLMPYCTTTYVCKACARVRKYALMVVNSLPALKLKRGAAIKDEFLPEAHFLPISSRRSTGVDDVGSKCLKDRKHRK